MYSTKVSLTALLSILSTLQGTSALPTGTASTPATITGHLTGIPADHHDLPKPVSEQSTTTLGAPLMVQATRTTTRVPMATGSNLTARRGPGFNSTVTHPDDIKFGSHYGWAGSFDQLGCAGNPVKGSDRPKFDDQACRKVDLPADYLGVYWGSWPLGFTNLGLFTDEGCKNKAAEISQGHGQSIGPGACIQLSQVANGTRIVALQSLV